MAGRITEAERRFRGIWRLFWAFIAMNLLHLPLTQFRAALMFVVCLGVLMLLLDTRTAK